MDDEIRLQILTENLPPIKSKRKLVCVKRTYHPWGMSACYKEIGMKKPWYKYLYQRLRIFYKRMWRYLLTVKKRVSRT